MSDTIERLSFGDREIILVGTAHISAGSVQEVKDSILSERPDCVCVEIDAGRARTLTEKNSWESLDVVKVIKEGKAFLLLANLVLSSFQKRMGSSTGVSPGAEMLAALDAAREVGARTALCDREIQVTLRRAWARSGFWGRTKLLASLVASAFSTEKLSEKQIEDMKAKGAIDDMMGELADYLPKVKEVLIDERDRYLAAKIWEAGGQKSLAVVGAGHMGGIVAWLEKFAAGAEGTDVAEIETVPPPSVAGKAAGWIVPIVLVGLAVAGFFIKGKDASIENIVFWLAMNSGLAGLGSLIALAHPLTILVTVLSAPLGTLNPFLAVGMFAGLAEAALRKPTVEDFETLTQDIASIKGLWKNRVTRILLIFFLSTSGGALGNFIAAGKLFGGLFGPS